MQKPKPQKSQPKPKPKPQNRYLIEYYDGKGTSPIATRTVFLGAVYVPRKIGEKAAMAYAEKLYAEHGLVIKALSATYEEPITRTHQPK